MDETMSKEESLVMIDLEIQGAEEYGTDTDLLLKLLNTVRDRINDDKMSYPDFMKDLVSNLAQLPDDAEGRENRVKLMNEMYVKMLNNYAEQQ